jgi:ABC-2 type transport system permease protein
MSALPSLNLWRAEGLRLRRQPLAWRALGALLAVLLAASTWAGLEARARHEAAVAHEVRQAERLREALQQFADAPPGPATAVATYQLGRGDLGLTRMAVGDGLALGVQRLKQLPTALKASLDSRHVDARSSGPLLNPLLTDTGLPDVPAVVALLLPLVALVLCTGLLQEEGEQGRLGLLRLQSRRGMGAWLVAALGWRWLALCVVAVLGTLPALLLGPGDPAVAGPWLTALLAFCALWVLLGGLLSLVSLSSAMALLAALGLWLLLTFIVPAALVWAAQREAPMPSRLAAIVAIRDAQQHSEDHEAQLARAWFDQHPDVAAHLPATWPASFVVRVLDQEQRLRPLLHRFDDSRARQAAFVERWAWLSPGLALVLHGERLAGVDTASHLRYLREVEAFENRWRDFLVPHVMNRSGITAEQLTGLPRFSGLPLRD